MQSFKSIAELDNYLVDASSANPKKIQVGKVVGLAESPLKGIVGNKKGRFQFRERNVDDLHEIGVVYDDGLIMSHHHDESLHGFVSRPIGGGKKRKTRKGKKASRRGKTSRR